jgi:hypothetical protein
MSDILNSTGDASDSSVLRAGLRSSGKPVALCAQRAGLCRELSDAEYVAVKAFVARVSEAHRRYKEVYSG